MVRLRWFAGAGVCAALLAASGIHGQAAGSAETASSKKVARGKYLVETMGCADCHTPKKIGPNGPQIDPSRFLMGHPEGSKTTPLPNLGNGTWFAATNADFTAWYGPWGVSYATNLTPDENTGIGSWSEETFIGALKTGKHMGVSRPILPPMPWVNYALMTNEDLSAMYAYLRTVKKIHNRIPDPEPPPTPATK
jgi:Cytochrome c